MKNNVKIVIRRGKLRKLQGLPEELLHCALAVVAGVWSEHKEEDATPEQLVQCVVNTLWKMLGRLGYSRTDKTKEKGTHKNG